MTFSRIIQQRPLNFSLIKAEDLELVADRRPGRPSKTYRSENKMIAAIADKVAAYGQKNDEGLVESAYNMLLEYDKALCQTAQHKSLHSTIHFKISPVLHLLKNSMKGGNKQ